METFFLFALVVLGIPFVLPIIAWVSARRTRARIEALEQVIERQRAELDSITTHLIQLRRESEAKREPAPEAKLVAKPEAKPEARPEAKPEVRPEAKPEVRNDQVPAVPPAPPAAAPKQPERPAAEVLPKVSPPAPPSPASVPRPAVVHSSPVGQPPAPPAPAALPKPAGAPQAASPRAAGPPSSPPPRRTPPGPPQPPEPPEPRTPAFDWESLVGVKLFSAIAGIALVLAAVFFLRYSIEAGWLQPPVRVAIGVLVAIALLVVCELKAARRYPMTANAMDAAAISILFATFFAAHALWDLIPSLVTFGLLAVVTLVAVLLSIRRESMFIAVLGLLGGFATPALLSTGENRPIPLFAYLLLLNVGLAWVAYSRAWPVLTWLTLLLTVVYQWGWVFKYLDAASLPLALGVFLVFPLASVSGLILGKPAGRDGSGPKGGQFELTALISAVLPLAFAVFVAGVPAYGARPELLFGFLLLIDAGLLAVAVARKQPLVHGIGALTTLIVMAVWLANSYDSPGSTKAALAFTSIFALFYAWAPAVARRFGAAFDGPEGRAQYAGSLLLFVFPVLAGIEPAFAEPWPMWGMMGALAGLVVLIAWRAMAGGAGWLYYIAAFFAIATQAVWSATHLTLERLGTAVLVYAVFGIVSLGVPIVARLRSRPLQPAWGSGAVLLVSLGLLLFLSGGSVAPAALWALALLLAILNAGLFVESAAGRLPLVSQIGSICSWIILMMWWPAAAGSVGVLPSLSVAVGLTLITLAGHAWSVRTTPSSDSTPGSFVHGLYLGLIGHLFLAMLAVNREWSLPPWPLFAALGVITLATSAAALWSRTPALHMAGTIAAAVVVTVWAGAAGAPAWGMTAVLAAAAVSVYALAWIAAGDRFGGRRHLAASACAVLFIAECALMAAVEGGAMPPFAALLVAHAANIGLVLALTAACRWDHVAIGAVIPAWLAVLQLQVRDDVAETWTRLLALAGVLYAIFVSYPFALAGRPRHGRDPYIAAILASAMAFFAARVAFTAGHLDSMIGIVPVFEGAVLAVMLRALLRLDTGAQRDTGRLAMVAGATLAFVTVAIPLQLKHQWVTIGWALEGAALAWLYRRIAHRGLLYWGMALLGTVFARLSLNPEVFLYEPRGGMRIFNWYLYTYLICAAALMIAGWWLSKTEDRLAGIARASHLLPAGATILLFLLLNIEIADYYAAGPTIMFRFGVTLAQDLTYTIGWLVFGMGMLAAGIYLHNKPARVAAVALIAVTTFKCFLYDLGSLEGLHRVASFVGLAISLALVSLALQKFVLSRPRSAS